MLGTPNIIPIDPNIVPIDHNIIPWVQNCSLTRSGSIVLVNHLFQEISSPTLLLVAHVLLNLKSYLSTQRKDLNLGNETGPQMLE